MHTYNQLCIRVVVHNSNGCKLTQSSTSSRSSRGGNKHHWWSSAPLAQTFTSFNPMCMFSFGSISPPGGYQLRLTQAAASKQGARGAIEQGPPPPFLQEHTF
eukprot:793779-Pelagomonas_calceolata.AAC.2